jgi:hypothetical protein
LFKVAASSLLNIQTIFEETLENVYPFVTFGMVFCKKYLKNNMKENARKTTKEN